MSAARSSKHFNWVAGLFIIGYHVALLIGLPLYLSNTRPGWPLLITTLLVFSYSSLGITAGYHRLFAHRTYRAHPLTRLGMLAAGTLAIQGSAVEWAADHRRHHAHVDTDDDPYSIKKGFFYAHMGWLFQKPNGIDETLVSDLMKDPVLRFQHRHYAWLAVGSNILLAALCGLAFGDWAGAFMIAWLARMAVCHHFTWFINSLAHTWGAKTYSREHSAVDNFLIAFVTMGEGYHNYHHTFASDYRNGVRWYHFDPSKWTIWALSRLGLTSNLRRYDTWQIQRRLLQEDRRMLLDRLRSQMRDGKHALEVRVTALSESIQNKLKEIRELREQVRESRRARACQQQRKAMRDAIRQLRRDLRQDWRSWQELCRKILAQPSTT